MSGRYPANIGMQSVVFNPDSSTGLPLNVTLMSNHLKNLGYSTHALGKWHLGELKLETITWVNLQCMTLKI